MSSDAYVEAQSAECSTWDTLSTLPVTDPGYHRALAQWHEAVQAMSLAMEKMLARRAGTHASAPTGPRQAARPASRRRTC